MSNGYDNVLQRRFPEGKVFSNAIFSLSVIEYCDARKYFDAEFADIVDRNIERMLSETARRTFSFNMQPTYGIFYNGWCQFVLKKYQESQLFKFSTIPQVVISASSMMERRIWEFQKDSVRIVDTYAGTHWPADNMIGILSMDEDSIRNEWVNAIFRSAAHESGLVNHVGSQPAMIRGSSQAMITFCLGEMKNINVDEYNLKFKERFVDSYLGVQLVREHEDRSDRMDADSGPVLWGYGASATIMNIKAQATLNESSSKYTWAAMNTIAFPINIFGRKYYLLKKEPMFDIFMLWGSVSL